MPDTTLTAKSVRIAEDEAKWLSVAASKGAVTQNDLIRLAVHRLRKELGAASRVKPEAVVATAKASRYKLTPPRAAAGVVVSVAKAPKAAKAAKAAKAPAAPKAAQSPAAAKAVARRTRARSN